MGLAGTDSTTHVISATMLIKQINVSLPFFSSLQRLSAQLLKQREKRI
jgi:hypothetical protein